MVEIQLNSPDEISIGLFLANGEDELGRKFHLIALGFLFFEINFYKYKN